MLTPDHHQIPETAVVAATPTDPNAHTSMKFHERMPTRFQGQRLARLR